MSRDLGDAQPVALCPQIVTILLRLCRLLQIDEAAIPGRDLYASIAEILRPAGNVSEVIIGGSVLCKLCQKNSWPFNLRHILYCLSSVAKPLYYGTTMYLDVSLSPLMISQRGTTRVGRFMSHPITRPSRFDSSPPRGSLVLACGGRPSSHHTQEQVSRVA